MNATSAALDARPAGEVFDDHLARADRGDIDGDIDSNFSAECVLLTTYGRFEGHQGVRDAARLLSRQVPNARYEYTQRSVHGEMAFLEWTASGDDSQVRDGADSFLIRNGRIEVMTIHYTVEPGAERAHEADVNYENRRQLRPDG